MDEQSKNPEAEGANRRTHTRYTVDEDSVVLFLSRGGSAPGRILDLSREGCCFRTGNRTTMQTGWPVEVSFTVRGVSFRFRGVVQWTKGGNLLGIRFDHVIPRRMAELAEVIDEMEQIVAAKAKAANTPASEKEASKSAQPNTPAGPGRPDTPQRKSGAQGSPPPVEGVTPPQSTHPQSSPSGSPRDRRRSLRQDVDTTAIIFLVKIGSTLKGRILDLSLGGCRIRTAEPFPVGIYTRVETEFNLKGMPFRLGGVIQAIHDRHTVGIRFLDLSDRKKQQVTELMAEIEEVRAEQAADGPV